MNRFQSDNGRPYQKIHLRLFTILLVMILSPPAFSAQTIEGNIDDIARAILTYFPKVTGKVIAVNDNQITVQVESGQGLSKGVLLTVFREGESFYHPVTDVPLGRFESEIGFIEILHFEKSRLTAKNIDPTIMIEVGDLVRLPSTKIPLAIATRTKEDHSFLQNELSAALNDTGRFQIDPLAPGADLKAAHDRKNRYYIELATDHQDGQFLMSLLIQNTITGNQLANLEVLIHQSKESDLILEHLQYQLFEQRQKTTIND